MSQVTGSTSSPLMAGKIVDCFIINDIFDEIWSFSPDKSPIRSGVISAQRWESEIEKKSGVQVRMGCSRVCMEETSYSLRLATHHSVGVTRRKRWGCVSPPSHVTAVQRAELTAEIRDGTTEKDRGGGREGWGETMPRIPGLRMESKGQGSKRKACWELGRKSLSTRHSPGSLTLMQHCQVHSICI